jgi:hypothetical protein
MLVMQSGRPIAESCHNEREEEEVAAAKLRAKKR